MIQRSAHIDNYEGRTLIGRAFYFDKPSSVTDDGRSFYLEEFARACANKSIADNGKFALGVMHDVGQRGIRPVGGVTFNAGADGLEFEAVVARSAAGDEVLELLEVGGLRDVSISARPIANGKRGNVLVRQEIALRELSLCPPGMGQHNGAEVLAVRSELVTPNHYNKNRLRLLLLEQ